MIKTVLVVCLVILTQQHQLQEISLPSSSRQELSSSELAQAIASSQTQILRKVVLHFLTDKMSQLGTRMSDNQVKEEIYQLFGGYKLKDLEVQLGKYMRSKLFKKLDMDNLSQSLKDEIQSSPETYFLTYDMYDLLID